MYIRVCLCVHACICSCSGRRSTAVIKQCELNKLSVIFEPTSQFLNSGCLPNYLLPSSTPSQAITFLFVFKLAVFAFEYQRCVCKEFRLYFSVTIYGDQLIVPWVDCSYVRMQIVCIIPDHCLIPIMSTFSTICISIFPRL